MAAIRELQGEPLPGGDQGRRPGGRQGRDHRRRRRTQAREALTELLVEHRFGTDRVVVEEYLFGAEVSLLAICDGVRALPLASAQDYKRIFDGDAGPNTGGMGSYSPVPAIGAEQAAALAATVHQPVLDELRRRGIEFHGVLYAGLMLTESGPKVLEFNARFGDPETQAILPRLQTDLLELLSAAAAGGDGPRGRGSCEWDERSAVTVVLASAGYPDSSSSGDVISGSRTSRRAWRRDPRRHRARRRRPGRDRRWPRAQRHRARSRSRAAPAPAPTRPPTRSTSTGGSCDATSPSGSSADDLAGARGSGAAGRAVPRTSC